MARDAENPNSTRASPRFSPQRRKLYNRFKKLERCRRRLLEEVRQMTAAELAFTPGPDMWSIQQVVEHLVAGQRGMIGSPESRPGKEGIRPTPGDRVRYHVVVGVLLLGIPVPVVSREMDPQGKSPISQLEKKWAEDSKWLADYIASSSEARLQTHCFRHPVAGPLTVGQLLNLGILHIRSHLRQINRNKRLLAGGTDSGLSQ